MAEGSAAGVMEHLNWGYIQLGLIALVFGGLQVWWIGSVFRKRDRARPQNGGEFRKHWGRISGAGSGAPLRRSGAYPFKAPQRTSVVLSRCQCCGAESLMGTGF